jgi:hypothetical protein
MTTPGQGELIKEDRRPPRYGVGAVTVESCGFCRASFTVPTPSSHVHNLRIGLAGEGTLTPHAVWCKVR